MQLWNVRSVITPNLSVLGRPAKAANAIAVPIVSKALLRPWTHCTTVVTTQALRGYPA